MTIRPVRADEIPEIVKIHFSAFPNFFLTSLGKDFLTFFYSQLCSHPLGILLGYYSKYGDCLGFCAGTYEASGFYSKLVRRKPLLFMMESFKLLFTHPKALIRLVKNFTKKNDSINDPHDYAELLSIAVMQIDQSKGIGSCLMDSFLEELKRKSIHKVSLTTDALNNDKTIAFYHKNGFDVLYNFKSYPNRPMIRLIRRLY